MPTPNNDDQSFQFDISLSVLNHLGRNLYRNFITVLGEAISNAWDADAQNVWIYIDDSTSTLVIKDDGIGMTSDDFQNKFLKIGYSKRKDSNTDSSPKGRPYIGRKGIGKLALLSCAERISIISKTESTDYVGGVIDNSGLDQAIDDDLTPSQYPLEAVDMGVFGNYTDEHTRGTIVHFATLKDGISNSVDFLKKAIALYFRFSLVDGTFSIYVNNEKISIDNLQELISNTEFLWEINQNNDPLLDKLKSVVIEQQSLLERYDINGFVASVKKPRDLKILGTGEKVGIDLFVNGRLREKDILKHIPSARIPESYMYGQIHFDNLDRGDVDRFTSSREGIVADDELFVELLKIMKQKMTGIFDQWDKWRLDHKKSGDTDNVRKSKKDRASADLFNEVVDEYTEPDNESEAQTVKQWSDELSADAEFNFTSYAECFISENLVRKYIAHKAISPASEQREIDKWRNRENSDKRAGNISIDIRQNSSDDLYYLSMEPLVKIAEPPGDGYPDTLRNDEKEFTPVRNAVMHTSLLTPEAKRKLTSVYDNIKAKVKYLLSQNTDGS